MVRRIRTEGWSKPKTGNKREEGAEGKEKVPFLPILKVTTGSTQSKTPDNREKQHKLNLLAGLCDTEPFPVKPPKALFMPSFKEVGMTRERCDLGKTGPGLWGAQQSV